MLIAVGARGGRSEERWEWEKVAARRRSGRDKSEDFGYEALLDGGVLVKHVQLQGHMLDWGSTY